jgi:hypothetical protein
MRRNRWKFKPAAPARGFLWVLFGTPRCAGRAREIREYVVLRLRSNLDLAEEWPVDDDIGQFGKISSARSPVISVWAPQILGVEEKVTETVKMPSPNRTSHMTLGTTPWLQSAWCAVVTMSS